MTDKKLPLIPVIGIYKKQSYMVVNIINADVMGVYIDIKK